MGNDLIRFDRDRIVARLRGLNFEEDYAEVVITKIVKELDTPCTPPGVLIAISLGIVNGMREIKQHTHPVLLAEWRRRLLTDRMPDLIRAVVPDEKVNQVVMDHWHRSREG